MKKLFLLCLTLITLNISAQDSKLQLKKVFKFSTFYGAINGGTSLSDVDVYSVTNGLQTTTVETPFDYSITLGVRKIARFGYENRANTFYNGTENTFSDAATVGKVKGFEFLFEADYRRVQGENYLDQHHFLRYVSDKDFTVKIEYLEDGFADIRYFEASERYRYKHNSKLSFNVGAVQRLSEPYGYDPLEEWKLSNGNLHYTFLALEEGYTTTFNTNGDVEYFDPSGNSVATSTEVWEAVAIPEMLANYTEIKRNQQNQTIQHSLVFGFDYYHYTKTFWLHSWGNLMPWHYDDGSEFSYHKYNDGKQWMDYSGGLIFGYKYNKHLGMFVEGTYNKYWNREWHDFSLGLNYVIF
jgi:hypothetical protein|tara:strand:- start:287 stop:1348 length:1062 start_codon:yes stop_codon:yes gene_type:complete